MVTGESAEEGIYAFISYADGLEGPPPEPEECLVWLAQGERLPTVTALRRRARWAPQPAAPELGEERGWHGH